MILQSLRSSTLFPYTTLFRSQPRLDRFRVPVAEVIEGEVIEPVDSVRKVERGEVLIELGPGRVDAREDPDRKSTRLNSSHANISYAVFCLKKKTRQNSATGRG